MGTPIDIEGDYTEGNACTICWGPGKTFGDVPTPKFLCLNVSGIEKCPGAPVDPPNGYWVLEQRADFSCMWERTLGPYYIAWWFEAALTFCWIWDRAMVNLWLFADNKPKCSNFVDSSLGLCGAGKYGIKGTVRLAHTKNPIAAALLLEYNLNRHENSFMESWPIEDGIEVVRYANLQTPMCVYVKHDSNLAEMHLEPFGPG